MFGMGTGVASSLSSPAILSIFYCLELVRSKLHNGLFLARGEVLDLLVLVR